MIAREMAALVAVPNYGFGLLCQGRIYFDPLRRVKLTHQSTNQGEEISLKTFVRPFVGRWYAWSSVDWPVATAPIGGAMCLFHERARHVRS